MDFKKIVIIGVGLIGSSFALALKKHGFRGKITGVGRREDNLISARDMGAIDDYSTDPSTAVKDADLVVLASFTGQFRQIIEKISSSLKKGTIVTDVGSVKSEVVRKLDPLLPEGVHFVGAHPIAGKECSGAGSATEDLFMNAKCIITPVQDTDKKALEAVTELWEKVGAHTITMGPEEHDKIFAQVSHMPHVAAYALVNSIMDAKMNILHYGGRGFRDMTRIAMSPAELWKDICSFNRTEILESLEMFSSTISRIKNLIENSDWDSLEKEFLRAKEARSSIESD